MKKKEEQVSDAMQKKESGFKDLERNYNERIVELEELIDFQEAEFGKALKEAELKGKQMASQLRAQAPPGEHAWEQLSEGGMRWARKVDVDFLVERLTERDWRAADVATALHRADLLDAVFETSEVWTLRIIWLRSVMTKLEAEHWGPSLTASMVVALNLSERNVDELRNLTGRRYDAADDRYKSIVLVEHPFPYKHEVVKVPTPFRPRNQWVPRLRALRDELKTEISEDGSTSSRRLRDEVLAMLHRDRTRMPEGCGLSPSSPIQIHFMSDGFPVTGFSLFHACLLNASWLPAFRSMSESQLSCLVISRKAETNSALTQIFADAHITDDWSRIWEEGKLTVEGKPDVFVELTLAADKKGAEANRGCGPCPVWCACMRVVQHELPWSRDQTPPKTFAELVRRLRAVCKGCLSREQILELAHYAPGVHCSVCKRVPYPTESEHADARAHLQKLARSEAKEDQRKYSTLRRDYAAKHSGQREFTIPTL
eukprot:6178301-Pleurochrysis_carterae.AAC.1